MKKESSIYITRPSLPSIDHALPLFTDIWESKFLTNNGKYLQSFEAKLARYLELNWITLTCNGTLALISAIHACSISGEVITTPFSFAATTHSLILSHLTPVFVDIEPHTCNIDPGKIEKLITPRTSAILPVHTYGNPVDIYEIERIARKHNLKVIYDAAHAFGVKYDEKSVLEYGDASILSFHATKCFTTFEGGAIITNKKELHKKFSSFINFGIENEDSIPFLGLNAKMNELQAAIGFLQLDIYQESLEKRKRVYNLYIDEFDGMKGINNLQMNPLSSNYNYSYFPIFIDVRSFGNSRDYVYEKLRVHKIFARKYFHPLLSKTPPYMKLPSSNSSNLKNAEKIASEVLCLPIYPDLETNDIKRICQLINKCRS